MVWNDPLESGIFVFGQAVMSYRLLMTKDSHGKYNKRLKIIFYIIYIYGLYVLARNNEEFVKP